MLHTPNRSLRLQDDDEDERISSGSRSSSIFVTVRDFFNGLKLFRIVLTLILGGIVLMEIKILTETTKTYNESLVNQMIQKNEALQEYLKNVTLDNGKTRELINSILKTNQENQLESLSRADVTDGKLENIQKEIKNLMEENKVMYQESESSFNENLKLVKDALTMNTKTVINLLDDNNSVRAQLLQVSSSHEREKENNKFKSMAAQSGKKLINY